MIWYHIYIKKIFYIYYIFMKMYAYVGIKIQYTILFVQNTVLRYIWI